MVNVQILQNVLIIKVIKHFVNKYLNYVRHIMEMIVQINKYILVKIMMKMYVIIHLEKKVNVFINIMNVKC